MQRIPLNGELRDKLLAVDGKAELVDENGNVLGEFHRAYDFGILANDPNWLSDEELDGKSTDQRTYTPEEVMERLRKLTKCE